MRTASRGLAALMRDFWDEKARENPLWYVSSYRPYGEEDPEEFWRWGAVLTDRYLAASGIAFTGGERVLEIGCGVGRMTRALSSRFRHVTAIDVSEEMVAEARRHLADRLNVEVRRTSGLDLADFPDGSFDLVFSYLVFQHLPDAALTYAYVREAGRVLRAGGHLLSQANNLPPSRPWSGVRRRARAWLGRRAHAADAIRPGPSGLDSPAWVGSRVTVRAIEDACHAGGCAITRLEGEGTQYMWVTAEKTVG